jgi:hypothetical protein
MDPFQEKRFRSHNESGSLLCVVNIILICLFNCLELKLPHCFFTTLNRWVVQHPTNNPLQFFDCDTIANDWLLKYKTDIQHFGLQIDSRIEVTFNISCEGLRVLLSCLPRSIFQTDNPLIDAASWRESPFVNLAAIKFSVLVGSNLVRR